MSIRINKYYLRERLVTLLIFWGMIQSFISNILRIFDINEGNLSIFYRGIFIAFLLYFIYCRTKRKIYWSEGTFLIALLTVFFVSMVVYNEYLGNIFLTLFADLMYSIVIIIAINSLNDITILLERFKPYVNLSIIYSVSEIVVYRISYKYDMTFSYYCVLPTLLSCILFLKEKRIRYIFIAIVNFVTTLYAGSRGALVCYFIFFIMILHYYYTKNKIIRRIFALVLIFTLILIIFKEKIIDFFIEQGIISRNLSLLKSKNIFYGAGREDYYKNILKDLLKEPIFPRGLYADRIFLSEIFSSNNIRGNYVHNFFFEILYQFGIIAIPIFLGLLINIHKCTQKIKISQNDNFRYLFIVSFSYAAGQLLISSSYLTSNSFGIFMGFMIYIIHIHVSQEKYC